MLSPEVIAQAEKRIGQTVGGKWQLDRVIGVGGMAAVYEATHRNRNRVAIKLLHPILSLDEGTRHRFLREGYVANTIRHEGAVQVLDDDLTQEGIAFLVMELLQGETVEDRMDRKGGAIEIKEALELTEQLLDVLCAAHDQGVIHRDIKPDNLFLTDDGRLKVLDFGIARLHQGDTRSTRVGSFMGTPAYCAPEQARGRWDEVDARTDLFSVAATLFTAITGDHVHPAETSSEQLALAIGATARSLRDALPQAPDELVQFVDKALSYDKDDRFQSARAMKAAIARVRAGLKDATISVPPRSSRVGYSAFSGSVDTTTIGGDTDSFTPTSFYPIKPPIRVLIGLLAAGVLAVFLLIATKQNEVSTSLHATEDRQPPPRTTAQAASTAVVHSGAISSRTTIDIEPKSDERIAVDADVGSSVAVPTNSPPTAPPAITRSSVGDKTSAPTASQNSKQSSTAPPHASFPSPSEPTAIPAPPSHSPPPPPASDDELFRRRF